MRIIHKIDDFLYDIFPDASRGDNSTLITKLEQFYTFGAIKPKVTVDDGFVIIEINVPVIESESSEYSQVIGLCEKGAFSKAKPILSSLINRNPSNSEYHRIMGQILSEEGDQDQAIDSLIDALRWDSKNHWALLMMGNIFAKYKNDLDTAQKYYDQAVVAKPDDNIAVNNIGANLMQHGKIEEAKKYFWKAINIDPDYPNSHFALGMIAEMENDLNSAFYSTCKSIKLCKTKDTLYHNSVRQATEIAQKIINDDQGKNIVNSYRQRLETEGHRKVESVEDDSIPTAAKLEIAENYDREYHRILFNPNYPAVEHLITHELVHLQFVIEARKAGLNLLFTSNKHHRASFIKVINATIKKLKDKGISNEAITHYISELFEGINRQMYNTPIDLFIEELIYNEFPELRPYQFLSLYKLIQDGVKAVTDKLSIELSPPAILSKSKVLNVVNALQFKELYGVDIVPDFKSSSVELEQAKKFYQEFKEYKDDREPAEEYELVLHWGTDLNLDHYFELIDENEFRKKRIDTDNLLESIENDPYDLESQDHYKKEEMEMFLKSQMKTDENMAVVLYMVEALAYFKNMSMDKIREIAYEIALAGRLGFRPDGENYNIKSIPGKLFTGYHILAYYYVSWMLAEPDMVSQLQLPFENEYKIATVFMKRHGNE